MEAWIIWIVLLLVMLIAGGFYFLFPRISRRGLLFGVYVGEQVYGGEEARKITRAWYVGMSLWLAVSLVVAVSAGIYLHPGPGSIAGMCLLLIGFLEEYIRAYIRARNLAPSGPPPAAAAQIGDEESKPLYFPKLAMLLGLMGGLLAIAYAWSHYAQLPDMVPTHFGLAGRPDAWKPRSLATVMLLPIMSLIMGVGMGGIAYLTGHAKRAIRYNDHGASFIAQQRFRQIMANFLAIVAVLVTAMMTLLSISSIQVALKERPSLPLAFMAMSGLLLLVALGGSIYIAIKYGQGGSRLERGAADAPLTNGLADNRFWVLGMFYVNRDDPSLFVEKRFGLGYTINFGNPKAVALMIGFIGLVILVSVIAVLTN